MTGLEWVWPAWVTISFIVAFIAAGVLADNWDSAVVAVAIFIGTLLVCVFLDFIITYLVGLIIRNNDVTSHVIGLAVALIVEAFAVAVAIDLSKRSK
jgi:hypothetical protein